MGMYLKKVVVTMMACCLALNSNLLAEASYYETKESSITESNLITNTAEEEKQLIYDCISAMNHKDVASYISLFTEDNVKYMNDFLDISDEEFFKENTVELIGLKKLSPKIGMRSAAVAVKSYSYYYTKKPKRNYTPYYAYMLDSTADQGFNYDAYSTICNTDTYKTYCKEAYAYAKARMMVVKSTGEIFETHYTADGKGYHSGWLSQNGILSLAKQGYTCGYMLKYYYDNSQFTDNQEITLVSAN